MPPFGATVSLAALFLFGLFLNWFRNRSTAIGDTKVSQQTRLIVLAFSLVWPIAVNQFVLPLFRLSADWGWTAALAPYCISALLLRSRFLTATMAITFIGILLGQLTESGVRNGPYLSQKYDEIRLVAFWLIAGIVVAAYNEFWREDFPQTKFCNAPDAQQDTNATLPGTPWP